MPIKYEIPSALAASLIQRRLDSLAQQGVRRSATGLGRRSLLARLGVLLVGGAATPMLPFDRSEAAESPAPRVPTETDCDYWRYCALGGSLCICCGGSLTACPPGSELSTVAWIGTCENPADKKSYLISYNDCCGKTDCGRCRCSRNERDRPGYRMSVNERMNWCLANASRGYHCTIVSIVGVAE